MTTPASTPPQHSSNEATDDQLAVARRRGDAYGKALQAMAGEDGAATRRAGEYLVAFVNEEAEGMYAVDGDRLVWREAATDSNAHLEVAVADATDGYGEPVTVNFQRVKFANGRKPSPDARRTLPPRESATPADPHGNIAGPARRYEGGAGLRWCRAGRAS